MGYDVAPCVGESILLFWASFSYSGFPLEIVHTVGEGFDYMQHIF